MSASSRLRGNLGNAVVRSPIEGIALALAGRPTVKSISVSGAPRLANPAHEKRCAKERISQANSTRFGPSRLRIKNVSLLISPKSVPSSRHPASSKRGVRVVTIRGVRVAVDAMALRARGIAGRSQASSWGCERSIRAGRAAQFAYGKSVWFWHPWLVSSWRRSIEIQPGSINRQSGSDGGKRNSSPGRARHKPSNQGRPDALRWTCMLVCALLCTIAHGTAGAARTRSSLRPLIAERASGEVQLGRVAPRERTGISAP
jgi:hypothetical protein